VSVFDPAADVRARWMDTRACAVRVGARVHRGIDVIVLRRRGRSSAR